MIFSPAIHLLIINIAFVIFFHIIQQLWFRSGSMLAVCCDCVDSPSTCRENLLLKEAVDKVRGTTGVWDTFTAFARCQERQS